MVMFTLLILIVAQPNAVARICAPQLSHQAARPPESILILGGGQGGAIAAPLIDGIQSFVKNAFGSAFRTASRGVRPAWPASYGHLSRVDRRDEVQVQKALRSTDATLIIDAAGAHMADAQNVGTIVEAIREGRRQARMLTNFLDRRPTAAVVFISSQYANPDLKDSVTIDKTFEVVGFAKPISVRLYAELKAGFEQELRDYRRTHPAARLIILRLGTLLSASYEAKSARALVEAGGCLPGKNFTPAEVLGDAIRIVADRLHHGQSLSDMIEISSRDDFAGPRSLGVRPLDLATYARHLGAAWGVCAQTSAATL